MINHETKDAVLAYLLAKGGDMYVEINIKHSMDTFGLSTNVVDAILSYFERYGLMECNRMLGGEVFIFLKVEAFDLAEHGGFTGKEELLEKNIKKLLLEIESFKPSAPDKIKSLTEIGASILSGLDIMNRWNSAG